MKGAVLDTHTAVWYLCDASYLSAAAFAFIGQTVGEGKHLCVSAISVMEVVYLVEKNRIPKSSLEHLLATLSDPNSDLICVSFSKAIALTARQIPREQVPDMPDRIIAATGLHLDIPVITRDRRIQAAGIRTIW